MSDAGANTIELPASEEGSRRAFLFSGWHLVLLPIALMMIIPLVWMTVTSLQTLNETRHYPPTLVPSSLEFKNYTAVLHDSPFTRWFANTLIVTLAAVVGNLVFCSLAGYA